ncbi:arginase [Aequorivita sp. H23M31]|uniref:Arginase n=1 Tax=Aequorivita ciconiae TaxID=2494375 RepID=A0A410G3H5_9FLAO|nr:formimidoylglutamase [Aequorivita sp. H23M31]QAA81803.1 arginase [Aequorivita sp. H23M31]
MIEFLSPVSESILDLLETLPPGTLGKQIRIHSKKGEIPNFKGVKFAILGIRENRSDVDFMGNDISFDQYRKAFYALYPGNWSYDIMDLGDIQKGESVEDTRFAAKQTISTLLKMEIIPLILGGGQDLAYGQYRAYDDLGKMVNVVNIDNRFDLGNADLPFSNKSYVGKMVVDQPYNLFNYSVLGYQSYFNSPEEISLMEKLYFDAYRLGEITSDISIVEPTLRDADIVTFDATSIKDSELSYSNSESPNGFDSREICAISRYAGISNRVSSFGIYEIGGTSTRASGAMLIAQILWYFIEGVNFRIKDDNFDDDNYFITYKVPIDDEVLTFKKSNRTERWWILLPFISNVNNKLKSRTLLPCTYGEYLGACNQEIPERWLKARHKNEV